jgi:hypothetical protein
VAITIAFARHWPGMAALTVRRYPNARRQRHGHRRFEQIVAALIMLVLATLAARQQKKVGDWLLLSRFFQFVGVAWLVGLAIYACFFF